jgi:hypothetical protein
MTFSTATIQGYVTYMKSSTTPKNRAVVNILLSVPNKRENGLTADTYKISVWDSQALSAAQYISAERKQIITVSGTLSLDSYSVTQGKPMMRLDFASILDYGNAKTGMSNESDRQKFANQIDKMEDAKEKAIATAKKVKATAK